MPFKTIREFIKLESSAGIALFVAAVFALIIDNTPWHHYYHALFSMPLAVQLGPLLLKKPLLLWVNDGMMAVFFLLVGLEIKRELFEGELNSRAKAMLPAIAALGGMVVPAAIYFALNAHDSQALRGWAIPTATDIAFSLGILALLGSRVSPSLKIFLTALAIFDDVGAIIIIAVFYTHHISVAMLALAAALILLLVLMNRFRVTSIAAYMIVGWILWVCVLKSGVHATLVGIVLGFAIPLRSKKDPAISPVRDLEHKLHPWVAFMILPLFAFANARISFDGMSLKMMMHSIPVGIALGLFFGKQLGIFVFTWIAVKAGLARKPQNSTWLGIYGISMIAGVGFTMSLFIGTLAFGGQGVDHMAQVRLGVIVGSLVSGLFGYLLLRYSAGSAKLLHAR
jgi:Na+:H+ antiporter, NhaA family